MTACLESLFNRLKNRWYCSWVNIGAEGKEVDIERDLEDNSINSAQLAMEPIDLCLVNLKSRGKPVNL